MAELAEQLGACQADRPASTTNASATAVSAATTRASTATCRGGVGNASAATRRHVPANHRRAPYGCPAGASSARQLLLPPVRAVRRWRLQPRSRRRQPT
ncbi:hypothetical protein OAO87_02895 [bacterium]|nr:hypothetical protein [bacterium]